MRIICMPTLFATRVQYISLAIDMINKDLQTINEWCKTLSVHPTKCQAIVVGSNRLIGRIDTRSLPAIIFLRISHIFLSVCAFTDLQTGIGVQSSSDLYLGLQILYI